jgi:hypothetical protein
VTKYPELPIGGDISDVIKELGKEKAQNILKELVKNTEEFDPAKWEGIQTNDTASDDGKAAQDAAELERIKGIDAELNKIYKGTGYFSKLCCLYRSSEDRARRVCYFVPVPTESVYKDDGVESEMKFKIKGYDRYGGDLKEITLTSEKFMGMNWAAGNWGYNAAVCAGSASKDYLREAIMLAGSKHAKSQTVYTHTGWRKIEDKWAYLHGGGAIGADNVYVELSGDISSYYFDKNETVSKKDALESAWGILRSYPKNLAYPLMAYTYLSPLNEFLRHNDIEPSFIVFLYGIKPAMTVWRFLKRYCIDVISGV